MRVLRLGVACMIVDECMAEDKMQEYVVASVLRAHCDLMGNGFRHLQ